MVDDASIVPVKPTREALHAPRGREASDRLEIARQVIGKPLRIP